MQIQLIMESLSLWTSQPADPPITAVAAPDVSHGMLIQTGAVIDRRTVSGPLLSRRRRAPAAGPDPKAKFG